MLNGAKWDADALRDQVRAYVVEHLGHPDGVLVADDSQAIKKGVKSVGVARQHCGATGQIENCQVMPMLTYASPLGHAFIDRRLYLPASWCEDPARLAEAGVPADVVFTTKPRLVTRMLADAIAAGVRFSYFTADSGYGRDPALRGFCHDQGVAYVMAVPVDLPLIGSRGQATRPDLVPLVPCPHERRSKHLGSSREAYDWAAVAVTVKDQAPADGKTHILLARRSISKPSDLEYFLAHAASATPIPELIGVAGMRWRKTTSACCAGSLSPRSNPSNMVPVTA